MLMPRASGLAEAEAEAEAEAAVAVAVAMVVALEPSRLGDSRGVSASISCYLSCAQNGMPHIEQTPIPPSSTAGLCPLRLQLCLILLTTFHRNLEGE